MSIREQHPQYANGLPDMSLVRICFGGEREVKDQDTILLPATPGQVVDGKGSVTESKGSKDYSSYKKRAQFEDFVREAVEDAIGIIHRKPADIELPESMEQMRDSATTCNESLQDLFKNINVGQLVEGRLGLLSDLPKSTIEGRENLPYIALYNGISIINWDDGTPSDLTVGNLNMVVLNESGSEREKDGFAWEHVEKYRLLFLGDFSENEGQGESATYHAVVVRPEENDIKNIPSIDSLGVITPNIRGKTSSEIPFTFINSRDINPSMDKPPLLGLADLCIHIYEGDADYRQSLFMQSQDTFVTTGATTSGGKKTGSSKEKRLGQGACLDLPKDATAQYVGVNSKGLQEQRTAGENSRRRAAEKSGKLLDNQSKAKESNEALETRIAAGTASLVQIVQAGAKGLEKQLKQIATWIGANPDDVKVTPNIDFEDAQLASKTLLEWAQSKLLGTPIAWETIHKNMQDRGLTTLSFEEESLLIDGEAPDIVPGVGVSVSE